MKDFVMAVEDKAVKHRLHHGVSQGHMPTKAWSKSTMSTFCLTSLGCLPTWQKEKMPMSCSNKAVVAITMHMPACNFRGTSRSISLANVPYVTLGGALLRVICTHLYVPPNWSLFLLM